MTVERSPSRGHSGFTHVGECLRFEQPGGSPRSSSTWAPAAEPPSYHRARGSDTSFPESRKLTRAQEVLHGGHHQRVVLRAHDVLNGGDQVNQGEGEARWPRPPRPASTYCYPRSTVHYGRHVVFSCGASAPLYTPRHRPGTLGLCLGYVRGMMRPPEAGIGSSGYVLLSSGKIGRMR
jgi:hypothetical protein